MNTRKTALLGLVLIGAMLYLTKGLLPSRQRQEGERKAFSSITEEQMARIDIARRSLEGSVERYTIARNPNAAPARPENTSAQQDNPAQPDNIATRWSLPAIRGALLDRNVLGELVNAIKDMPIEDPLSDRELNPDLSVYGLDKPGLTVVVHRATGEPIEAAFGKKNEYLSKRYTKISGRAGVFLVPDALFTPLNKGPSDIRSKNPVQFKVTDVREALVTSSQGRIKLSQPVVDKWTIVEPRELPASVDAVTAMLNSLNGVTVAEFVDVGKDQYAKYGFNSPRVTIHLQMREGLEPQQIVFSLANSGASTGGPETMYLQASTVDSLFKLASDPSPALVKRLNDLRERAIVGLTASTIEKVVSSGQGVTPTTIAASGLLWTVNGKESDPVFMEQYLKDLANLKADDFPENVPADAFTPPHVELTVATKGEDKQEVTITLGTLVAGSPDDPRRYIKTSRSDTVYAIRDVEAKRIVPHEEALAAKATPTPVPTKD